MSMFDVIAVVGEDSPQTQATLRVAIELAERENARLTLAKTRFSVCSYAWAMPFGPGPAYVDPSLESPEQACRAVAHIARAVPLGTPLTTLVLDQKPQKALVKLIAGGNFGAVVADAKLLARCRRLRRLLARNGVLAVPVMLDAEHPGRVRAAHAGAAAGEVRALPSPAV
jgi:hypothetical protein